MPNVIHCDFETFSCADLKRVGVSRYSKDPTTGVSVIGWAINDGPVNVRMWPHTTRYLPSEIDEALRTGAELHAWNASFEVAILASVYGVTVPPERVVCTMQRALYAGLPASLGDCGPALGLTIVKDATAHGLMLRMSKPRSLEPLTWWHEVDRENKADKAHWGKLEALAAYCRRDVEAEREIGRVIPYLPPMERAVSLMDARANARGIRLDLPLIGRMLDVAAEARAAANAECAALTDGFVTDPANQVWRVLNHLEAEGCTLEGLSKEQVKAALCRTDLTESQRRLLELRQLVAKSSTKKLQAMAAATDSDERIRGCLAYYGASRTGRWAGRLVQPQNMPRGTIKGIKGALEAIAAGAGAEALDACYGPPLDVLSSGLRGCIIPGKGKRFVVYDLSQIEARMVAWLAGQQDVLDVFESGEDVYVFTQHKLGLNSRQEGKVAVLGLGFGMGAAKFIATAAGYGLQYSEDKARGIVNDWRGANPRIVDLWGSADRAIKSVVKKAQLEAIGVAHEDIGPWLSVTCQRDNGSWLLTMRLPSGRLLYYRDVQAEADGVSYAGVNQQTRAWERIRSYGGKWIENATQAAARDVVAQQALEIERLGLGDLVLMVHDEVVVEVPEDEAESRYAAIGRVMNTAPEWAQGLPVRAEGGIMDRYGK